MRKLMIVLSLLVYSSNLSAQITDLFFGVTDPEIVKTLTDSIVKHSNHPFKYVTSHESTKQLMIKYKGDSEDNKNEDLEFIFYIRMKGENKDLEIKGVKTYYFYVVQGKFLRFWDFWSKCINPEITQEEILKSRKNEVIRILDNNIKGVIEFYNIDSHENKWRLRATRSTLNVD